MNASDKNVHQFINSRIVENLQNSKFKNFAAACENHQLNETFAFNFETPFPRIPQVFLVSNSLIIRYSDNGEMIKLQAVILEVNLSQVIVKLPDETPVNAPQGKQVFSVCYLAIMEELNE